MTKRLNQVLAIEKDVKKGAYGAVGETYKTLQKEALFDGFHKEYQPDADDGERLPPEAKRVQYVARDMISEAAGRMSELFKVVLSKDLTNTTASADVTVNGAALLTGIPPTHLLFLEKQLKDIRDVFRAIPVLDPSEDWTFDDNSGLFKSRTRETTRTKKTQKAIVMYDATEKHPAQTQLITEDIGVGVWSLQRQSGAMRKEDRDGLIRRTDELARAVKEARERANQEQVPEDVPDVGKAIFDYILGT